MQHENVTVGRINFGPPLTLAQQAERARKLVSVSAPSPGSGNPGGGERAKREGYILAMRLLQSNLELDDDVRAAMNYFLPQRVPDSQNDEAERLRGGNL